MGVKQSTRHTRRRRNRKNFEFPFCPGKLASMVTQTQIFPGKRAPSVAAEIPFAATPPPAPPGMTQPSRFVDGLLTAEPENHRAGYLWSQPTGHAIIDKTHAKEPAESRPAQKIRDREVLQS